MVRLRREAPDDLRAAVEAERERAGLGSCQYALGFDGDIVASGTLGDASSSARYVIWSATKILVPAVVWQLMGERRLDVSLPVATWWPGFAARGKGEITLAQVMSHAGGFPNAVLSEAALSDRALRVAQMESWELEWEPGTRFVYHSVSAHWVLAELLARLEDADHRVVIRRRLLDPLGLDRLELGTPLEHQADVRPMRVTGEPATAAEVVELFGEEHARVLVPIFALGPGDEDPDRVLSLLTPAKLVAGVPGGGAVSDAASLASLYQALLQDPKGMWDPEVLRHARSTPYNNNLVWPGVSPMRGLGVEIAGVGPYRDRRIGSGVTSPEAFGHPGAFGQVAWADPATGLSFVFLTDTSDRNAIRVMRRDGALNAAAVACVA
jgi:CubicO group peptidase (beta-lactamase class C family)